MPYKDLEKQRESDRIRMRRFREKHKNDEKYLKRRKLEQQRCWAKNKERYNEKHKEWYYKNRDEQIARIRKYNQENKAKLNEYKKAKNKIRRQTDNNFLIKSRLRCLLYNSLKLYGNGKRFSSSKYGIDFNAVCEHLGKCPGRNRKDWHIDHIIPVSSFDLTKKSEVKKAFAPSNLQWLPAEANIRKSNKLNYKSNQ